MKVKVYVAHSSAFTRKEVQAFYARLDRATLKHTNSYFSSTQD